MTVWEENKIQETFVLKIKNAKISTMEQACDLGAMVTFICVSMVLHVTEIEEHKAI
jgi:hypothetical protein